MNIEEESKAFIFECCDMMGNAYYPADTGFANGEFYEPTVQRLFAVWLKAKAHAAEMAKPAVTITFSDFTGRWAIKEKNRIHMTTFNRNVAVSWAEASGYRVISE